MEGLYLACLEGLGIARLSEWNVREEVEMGRLRPIALEDANMPREAIWAVYPSLAFTPARVRMFIEAFRAHLR